MIKYKPRLNPRLSRSTPAHLDIFEMGKPVFPLVLIDRDEIVPVGERLDSLSQQEQLRAPLQMEPFFLAEGFERGAAEPFLAEFHFHEHDRVFPFRDDVDFASPDLPVGRDDAISGTLQVRYGDFLSAPADGPRMFGILRHGGFLSGRIFFFNHGK
jgi:hypothetical protein